MNLGLKDKVAIVGGGSRGLGRAIAEELVQEGARVAIVSRNASAPIDGVLALQLDLSEPGAPAEFIERVRSELGPIDILVTNQGGPPPGPFETHDEATWSKAYSLLLASVVEQVRGVLPDMKSRGWGRIITITSIAVKQPNEGLILSNSLRAGVTGLAKSLANELAPHGITVNNVMPGYTRTERLVDLAQDIARRKQSTVEAAYADWASHIPIGRIGEPRELAALVAFLASDRASYITGTSIPVDGGWIRSLL